MESMSPEERKELARTAAQARWRKARLPDGHEVMYLDAADDSDDLNMTKGYLPEAKYKGVLNLVGTELPCYVLSNGQRVVGRTSFTELLTGIKGGGGLEKYLGVESFKPFIPLDEVLEKMVPFRIR
jgi:hypothetical protein